MANEKEKSREEKISEELMYKKKTVFEVMTEEEKKSAFEYADRYSDYLFHSKTEREAVKTSIEYLSNFGYVEYSLGDKVVPGGKYYLNNRGKSLFAFQIGTEYINNGVRICGAHIDSPRLDLKQHPLFEKQSIGYFKTHYYGGIRKYQWPTLPLALYGVVVLEDGSKVDINIGDSENDPVFVVTDLLPHLGREQGTKPLNTAFTGEDLNILVGSEPLVDEEGKPAKIDNAVRVNILKILNDKYGITENDFVSAELCAVPAGKPVDVGFDRSMIGAYGHDDKVCAFPALTALTDKKTDTHTIITVLADKEETGSDGVSGMQCNLLSDLIDEIAESLGGKGSICKSKSMCLSADVNAGYDPNYPEVFEINNASLMNCGVVMSKFTGSGGKYSTNDASAEYVGKIRNMFAKENVLWQSAELGKVDAGGGGTIAKYVSKHNIETVDLGVPVLSMHAPFELISKGDLYETYKAFIAFCN